MVRPGALKSAIIIYVTDAGELFTTSQAYANAVALGNNVVPTRINPGVPERWKLRKITVQTIADGELFSRRYVIGFPSNPLWTGAVNNVLIDGVMWHVTSRTGEYRRGPFSSTGL
jgi:hypothetical protein